MENFYSVLGLSEDDEGEMMHLGEAYFNKDYTHEALAFISNTSRTINYWGTDVDILPPAPDGQKRRKYAFVDLVYLRIVKECRDFGMEKDKIYELKQALYRPIDYQSDLNILESEREEIEKLFAEQFQTSPSVIKEMFNDLAEKQEKIKALKFNLLSTYIFTLLGRKQKIRIVVNKEGKHFPYVEDHLKLSILNAEFVEFMEHSFLSISLSDIISTFFNVPVIKDELKQRLYPKEWKLIKIIREKKPDSVQINFSKGGEMMTAAIRKEKRIAIESRIYEILIKGGYEGFTIKTMNGKIVKAVSEEKVKL